MNPAHFAEHRTDTYERVSHLVMPNGSLVAARHQALIHAMAREVLTQWR